MPINLFGNWIDIQREPLAKVRENLNYELTLEVRPNNRSYDLLFAEGKSPNAIAKCGRCHDVIFSLGNGQYARVHLTWEGASEKDPFPRVQLFDSIEDTNQSMRERGCGAYEIPLAEGHW